MAAVDTTSIQRLGLQRIKGSRVRNTNTIRRYRIEHLQVEMGMRLDTSGHDQLPTRINDRIHRVIELRSYQGYLLTPHQHIWEECLARHDDLPDL